MEQKKDVEKVLAKIAAAEAWRDSNYGELWRDSYRRYRSQAKRKREGSNLFVPHTFMQVEVVKARISESLFASRPFIGVLPREGSDVDKARKIELLLDWQFNERMDMPRIIGDTAAASMIIYGTTVLYTGWLLQTRRGKRMRQVDEPLTDATGQRLWVQGKPAYTSRRQAVETEITLYDDPIVQPIDLFDFFIDPQAESIAAARYCGHKEYQTREQLDALVARGKYRIDWQKLTPVSDMEGGRKMRAAELGRSEPTEDAGEEDAQGLYLVHHYWEDNRHLVTINRQQVICDEENIYLHGEKPYDKCCYVSVPGEFYGVGIPEILSGLQDELNTTRNQRIDYNSMALRRMWKLRKGTGLTAKDLIWRQNGILQVENMDDVAEINVASLPSSAFANETAIKQDMQDTTGCLDILMGVNYLRETATTTMTRDNNASLRFKTVVSAMIKDLLAPIAKKCLALDQQFLSEVKAVRLLNEDAQEILQVSPYELDGDYDVIYCGAATEPAANKELTKERTLQAYSLAMQDPAYQADDVARLKLFRKVLEALEMKDALALLPQSQEALPAANAETLPGAQLQ